jgi:hypothetical protein
VVAEGKIAAGAGVTVADRTGVRPTGRDEQAGRRRSAHSLYRAKTRCVWLTSGFCCSVSSGLGVLVDQSAEDLATPDGAIERDHCRIPLLPSRRLR